MTNANENTAPVVFVRDGAVYANSRDVAACFGKRHRNVLRDVQSVLTETGEWGLLNFERTPYVEAQNGQTYHSYNMTKNGFTYLIQGYNGAKVAAFKIAYIERFDEMEATLRNAALKMEEVTAQAAIISAIIAPSIKSMCDEMFASFRAITTEASIKDDPRVAALEYVGTRKLMDDAGVPSKGRTPLNKRIESRIAKYAEMHNVIRRKAPNNGPWLYPVDLADSFMRKIGKHLIAEHLGMMGDQPSIFDNLDAAKPRKARQQSTVH